ncbi:trypsin-like serine peptidase [Jannaschia seohaensis]|uniref:Trypsin n=1 Tax=Jannaschia seohaensis TaxID=475081 RepID=A0A2Y9ABN7_9RHOB|nr:trypsin-like serine protease [Jannaschia seohaensis]PWJ20946.1 trypsin [Jannaschia seohaensis]SSA41356.1 Trypsin [Jannaschia seohaensis]
MRLVIFVLMLATQASAQPVSGRIETSAHAWTCSATQIAPDLILTAAHCLSPEHEYGYRPGLATLRGTWPVSEIHRHPVFGLAGGAASGRRYDIALATVAPVPGAPIVPVDPGPPEVGETLILETWLGEDGLAPVRRGCPVLALPTEQVVLGCKVVGGQSGGAVLRAHAEGPKLVAVATARMRHDGRDAALATLVAPRLDVLLRTAGREGAMRP